MRIHRLRISGFGPFAGTEEIDFDALSAHGLFLLNGPTGAGKTSVLDAICFALYGSVPGARQDGKRLRSDHAEPGQEPAVSCEFSAQGRRFDVTRSPAWDKPSARGKNGFTTQQAKTLLRERVDGTWVEKSTRNDEAGAEILALLGMDREQFTRVVMLPQGDFAAFLRSKATDRLELLQKLFGTERFEAVEQELSQQAQAAKEGVAVLNGQLELLAARAESEAGTLQLHDTDGLPEDSPAANVSADIRAARLDWLKERAAERKCQLSELALAAESEHQERKRAVAAETALRERHRRLEEATTRQAAVEEALPRLEDLNRRLGRHRKAEVLAGQLRGVDAAAAKVRRAADAMESAFTLLRLAADEDPELGQLDLGSAYRVQQDIGEPAMFSGAADELNRLRSLLAVVEARLPDEERLKMLRSKHQQLLGRQQELTASNAALDRRVEELLAERARLMSGLESLEGRAGAAALRAKEATAAGELLDVVRRYGAAVRARNAAKLEHDQSRGHQLETKRRWLDVREQRLANAAAELAAKLVAGENCPVCGSAEHPSPAAGDGAGPGLEQEEEAAHQLSEAAEAGFARAGQRLADADQLVAVLAGQGGGTAMEEAVAGAEEARLAAADAEQAVSELASARSRLEALEAGVTAARASRAAAEAELATVVSSLADLAEQSSILDQALGELRAGHRSLSQRLRALENAAAMLSKAVEAQAALATANAQVAEAREHLELALPEAGFATAEEARAHLLSANEAAGLETEIRSVQDEAARVAELFASDEVVLALKETADGIEMDQQRLPALEADAAAALQAARDADVAVGLAARCLESLTTIAASYNELAGSARGPAEHARMLSRLADAAAGRGDNTYRMSLNSYVLAARLEQVALAASERLVAMSDGRYLLQHTDAKAARGAKSGLGLEVVDQWTGHRRDTSTLSGGESFMASLSLALGLADVVQQESGGVEIETLFVDEGFGSLDEQSLEQVMDALEGLRDGGRVVGLVSHVAEMKQRIGMQLQVLKGRNGSTLRISEAVEATV
ncbi:recF/RecN/SMC N terminal domain protein [Pseudarthrobacter siccitolerans]|uniref:Nuclease SbcCD subunit C n=1 Tax=Pseudarthrobacter siccitolerans TaxID=861266 RepID=A0A024H0F7_9MICC|nr:SMC family ATPase [Pseudarthrobacter siccitolerans]CCQ45680.1 recF/RecN/SMC N terminal domain protein [Pseudarthrobacter siccitolerans]